MTKNVLVFGGSGFLGNYLIIELMNRGYSVVSADIIISSNKISDVHFIKCDISEEKDVEYVFKLHRYDYVYNLAGFANLDDAIEHPIETMRLNVIANMHILNQCVKHDISRFIYASSAYAMSNKGSFYGISKLASEKIIEEYRSRFNLPFTIIRYGSVYSELPYENNYLYNLIKEAIVNGKIDHNGSGNEIREYIHASDASKLSVDVLELDDYCNQHLILTGNERLKRSELFEMIKEMLNEELEITCRNELVNNHYHFTPYSFTPILSKKLVANPYIDMGQGLLKCISNVYGNLE